MDVTFHQTNSRAAKILSLYFLVGARRSRLPTHARGLKREENPHNVPKSTLGFDSTPVWP